MIFALRAVRSLKMKILISTLAIVSCLTWWKISTFPPFPKDYVLDIAFPYDKKIEAYDPAKIHFAQEYILLESIYSPLIELSYRHK